MCKEQGVGNTLYLTAPYRRLYSVPVQKSTQHRIIFVRGVGGLGGNAQDSADSTAFPNFPLKRSLAKIILSEQAFVWFAIFYIWVYMNEVNIYEYIKNEII